MRYLKHLRYISFGAIIILLAACNIAVPQDFTPTPEILISDTPTPDVTDTPTLTPSATPSVTPTLQEVVDVPVIVATPMPTQPDLSVPTQEANATNTPEPWTHTVQSGETLGFILQLQPWGYPPFDEAIINTVLIANGLTDPSQLREGQVLTIPRRTPTPIPQGIELTQAAAASRGVQSLGNQEVPINQEFGEYVVEEGDTILGIMEQFDTTLEILSQLNRNLNWFGCNFTNPSGGPNCNPGISIGQAIQVPLPTRTPVPTNTPSGDETATPTPTYPPAIAFNPFSGAIVSGRVTLQWTSVGVLNPEEVYLIEIVDRTIGTERNYATEKTSYTLPDNIIPTDGQARRMEWRVSVAQRNPDGSVLPIGGAGNWRVFEWRSR